jgi:aspartate/methionine/tyrosine aminotransferase
MILFKLLSIKKQTTPVIPCNSRSKQFIGNEFYKIAERATTLQFKLNILKEELFPILEKILNDSYKSHTDEYKPLIQDILFKLEELGSFTESFIKKMNNYLNGTISIDPVETLKELEVYRADIGDYKDGPIKSFSEGVSFHTNNSSYASPGGVPALREKVLDVFNPLFNTLFEYKNSCITPGETPALDIILKTILEPGDKVAISNPYYAKYKALIYDTDCIPITYELPIDINQLETIFDNIKVMIINDPHNPTGACLTEKEQKKLLTLAKKKGVLLLYDAAYELVRYDITSKSDYEKIPTLLKFLDGKTGDDQLSHVIYTSTFGKPFKANGFRTAWVFAHSDYMKPIIGRIGATLSCTSHANQYGTLNALDHVDEWLENLNDLRKKRDIIDIALSNCSNIAYSLPKAALYFFLDVDDVLSEKSLLNADQFVEECLKNTGLSLVPGRFYGISRDNGDRAHVRLAFSSLEKQHIELAMNKFVNWINPKSLDSEKVSNKSRISISPGNNKGI